MQLNRFLQVFTQVRPGTKLLIKGYRSQDGSVKNHTVEVLNPQTGYRDMVRDSLDLVESMLKATFIKWPDGVDPEDGKAALIKLKVSFQATLAGTTERHFKEKLVPAHGMPALSLPEGATEPFVLLHLRSLHPAEVVKESDKKTRATRGRDPVVVAADRIKMMMPIGSYVGRLNLVSADLTDVEILA